MSLFDVLRPEAICAHTAAASKGDILREIATLAKNFPCLEALSAEDIYEGLSKREELGSTGFGDGIAIPHCRLDGIEEFVVGLVTSKEGVDFDSLDKKPAHIFVFIIGPSTEVNDHVHLLSEISHALHVPGASNEILAETSAEPLRESFLRHVLDEVEDEKVDYSLFHVFVQKEDLFENVLDVFTAMSTVSISVIDGNDSSEYLNSQPMFANFFTGDDNSFHRVIMATVQKRMANETQRQIDKIVGGLRTQKGVLVIIQDLFFIAGGLNT